MSDATVDLEPAPRVRLPAPPSTATGGRGSGTRQVGTAALLVGALGVVFGDIGTSVLYALHTVFASEGGRIGLSQEAIYGVISMVVWTVTLVVSVKYVTFVMRADNDGEGGVMALIALIARLHARAPFGTKATLIAVGILGAALFVGDVMITPAISVLSAVEGLEVISPSFESAVLPISLATLVALFVVQRFGTATVGRFFGPICALWFGALAAGGLGQLVSHPATLTALSPTHGVQFAAEHPGLAFLALTGVVLTITGVEALYADMGHFGRPAIRRAWFLVVFPALTLNYLGQGALLLHTPGALENPFFLLYPGWAQLPMVMLATAATVIASQAVISGGFSIARQAVQLGFLPRLRILHTSRSQVGQVYVPAINWGLLVAVVVLILAFRESANLAAAYGIAVTGTLVVTAVLFGVVLRHRFGRPLWVVLPLVGVFVSIDALFLAANARKVFEGGWLPLVVAAASFTLLMTWNRGRELVTRARTDEEGPLREYVCTMHAMDPPLDRGPGTAVFLNANPETAPLALRANVEHNHVLHEGVVIVSVEVLTVPTVAEEDRVQVDDLGFRDDGIFHVHVRHGFQDEIDVPAALDLAARRGLECSLDLESASYFLSRITLRRGGAGGMARWRKGLFLAMARHAANPAVYFNLPIERTIVMGGHITV